MNSTYSYSNYGSSNYGSSYPSYQGSSYSSYPEGGSHVSQIGDNDSRLIGAGFAFPFLLGGVTGAAIAPAFWRPPYNRPYYGPGPFYGPGYYGPYRPF